MITSNYMPNKRLSPDLFAILLIDGTLALCSNPLHKLIIKLLGRIEWALSTLQRLIFALQLPLQKRLSAQRLNVRFVQIQNAMAMRQRALQFVVMTRSFDQIHFAQMTLDQHLHETLHLLHQTDGVPIVAHFVRLKPLQNALQFAHCHREPLRKTTPRTGPRSTVRVDADGRVRSARYHRFQVLSRSGHCRLILGPFALSAVDCDHAFILRLVRCVYGRWRWTSRL